MKHLLPVFLRRLGAVRAGLGLALLLGGLPAAAQVANDDCAQAVPVPVLATCSTPVNGTVQGATQSLPPAPACSFAPNAQDVWYSFVATTVSHQITLAPRFQATLDVRSGTCASSASVFCANVFSGNTQPTLVPALSVGQTYFIRVYAANGFAPPAGIGSTFALCVAPGPTPPANDDCAGAVALPVTTTCSPVSGTLALATQSLPPTTNCSFGALAQDVWYSFVATGAVQTVTLNASFGAVIDVRSGTCANSTSVYCNAGFGGQPRLVTGLVAGQTYLMRVYADASFPLPISNSTFSVCVGPGPTPPANDECASAVAVPVTPTCTSPVVGNLTNATQSLPATVNCGFPGTPVRDVWYSFVATGSTQLLTVNTTFGVVLDVRSGSCAASTSVFCTTAFGGPGQTVGGLTSGQTYFIRVYPSGGFVPFNATFGLCVGPGPVPPANDECAGALPVPVNPTCTSPVFGNVANASQSLPATPNCSFGSTARDVWYSFVASGSTQSVTVNAGFGAVIDVRSGTCGSTASVFCGVSFGSQAQLVGGLTSGQTYFIRVYAEGGGQPFNGSFTLCVTPGPIPPLNDECDGAIFVPITTTCTAPTSGNLTNASQSIAPTANCGFTSTARDVWYSFEASSSRHTITLNSNFNAVIDVRSGTCGTTTSIFCTAGFPGQGILVGGLTSGQTYFIRVYPSNNFVPNPATFTLCVGPGPTPPANDECAGAIAVPIATNCFSPVNGTVASASQSLAPSPNCGFGNVANDVWYSFVASGVTQTLTLNPRFQATMDVRTGTCASSTSVFCTNGFAGAGVVATGLVSGQTYFLRVYASGNFVPPPFDATFTLCITPGPQPAANDNCAAAVAVAVVQNCTNSTNGSVANASQSLPPTASCGNVTTAADVWYSFVASAATQQITLSPRFAAVLDVRTGTCASSTSRFCATVQPNSGAGTVVGGLTSGQTYFIRVYADGNFQPPAFNATFTLCITPAPTPPANDECVGAIAVPVTTTCAAPTNGTVEAASQSLPASTACGFGPTSAQDVWYQFVAGSVTQLITLNPRFPAILDLRTGTCASSTSLFCTTVFPNSNIGRVVGGLTSGQTYYLRVYADGNQQPSPLSATFTLCINPGPVPPANDECAGAVALPVTATCTPTSGTVAAASQSLPATINCGFGGGGPVADVWYSFVATGPAHSITLSPQFPALLDVRSGSCASSTSIFCNLVQPQSTRSVLVGGLTAGQTYFIRVYSDLNPTGTSATFTLCVTPAPTPPANDECAGAIDVPVQFTSGCASQTSGSNVTATGSSTPAPGCAAYQGGDIWFKTTVPSSGQLTVRTVVSASGNDVGDTGLSVYSGTCTGLTELGCDDDAGGSFKSLLDLTGRTPGEVLYIRVWGYNGESGTLAVCVTGTGCPVPLNLAATGITSTGASLSWQPGNPVAPGTTFAVEYGLQGFVPGTGTLVTGLTSPSLPLTNLLASRTYCFYVRQSCPGSPNGALAGPSCFQTLAVAGGAVGDEPCGAQPLVLTPAGVPVQTVSGSTVAATTSAQPGIGAPTCAPTTTPQDVWFTMTPAAGTNTVTLTLTGSAAGTVRVFTAPDCAAGPFTLVACRSSGANNTGLRTVSLPNLVAGRRYYVAVSGYGAGDTPGSFTIAGNNTVTSTRLQAETNALQVYPNPSATGQLTLRLSGLRAAGQATLLNALGQAVRTVAVPSGASEQTLKTNGLATGLYTLRVVVGQDVLTRKVVLE